MAAQYTQPLNAAGGRPPAPPRQVVVARYAEDVAWAEGLPAVVYNKGIALDTRLESRTLPNVGRESHTYLHHIISCWDSLAEITLFAQGKINDHLSAHVTVNHFFESSADVTVPWLVRLREWDPADGHMRFGRNCHVREKIARGVIRRARLSFPDWCREYIGIDAERLGSIAYTPGAIFSVRREIIQRKGIEFYQRVLATICDHVNPEEGYYCEQVWMYIFGIPEARIRYLYVPPNPFAVR